MKNAPQTEPANAATLRSAHGRKPLSVAEIIELEKALMEVFRTIRNLREKTSAARHIKFPPLPSVFTESIAIAAAPVLFGPEWKGRYGGRLSDVIVQNSITGRTLRIEVKGTGQHGFQEIKDKDLHADVLVWIRFGCRLEEGSGCIETAVIENPGKYVTGQRRLDLRRFEAIPGIRQAQRVFRFESLIEMLSRDASHADGSTART